MGGRGSGAAAAAPSGASSPRRRRGRSDAALFSDAKHDSRAAAELFGVAHDKEFETLFANDFFRDELSQMRLQALDVRRGKVAAGDTAWGRLGMTPTELAAVRYYTSFEYGKVNAPLRDPTGGGLYSPKDPKVKARVEYAKTAAGAVNRGLDKLPAHTATVYRGFGDGGTEALRSLGAGSVLKDKAFLSTSKEEGVAKSFGKNQLVIQSKRGRDISRAAKSPEAEVLFKTNTRFRVVSNVQNSQGGRTLYLEEID